MPDISFFSVLPELVSQPALAVILVLGMATLFMNGAHDASNAISTCVATRSMRPGVALAMAATCNFLGVSLATLISTAVAKTMIGMVNFSGDSHAALIALAAAMVAIVIWGGITWYLGIPSSQSHALIAGITGAAIALQGGLGGVNGGEWVKVLWGLVVAAGLGFGLGWLISKLTGRLCRNVDHSKAEGVFGTLQDFTAGLMAFLHGAQDGQKFMSICVLGMVLALGGDQQNIPDFPLWIMILCSTCMCVGTAVGGKKIIKSVGTNIYKMEKWEGFDVTLAASTCILFSNMTGLPISTTHANTTAIMGVGTAHQRKSVNWGAAKNMVKAWIYTFPGCGLIGFVLAWVFILIF